MPRHDLGHGRARVSCLVFISIARASTLKRRVEVVRGIMGIKQTAFRGSLAARYRHGRAAHFAIVSRIFDNPVRVNKAAAAEASSEPAGVA